MQAMKCGLPGCAGVTQDAHAGTRPIQAGLVHLGGSRHVLQEPRDMRLTFMSLSFLLMRKWSAPSTFRASSFFLAEVEMTVTSQPMALAAASGTC